MYLQHRDFADDDFRQRGHQFEDGTAGNDAAFSDESWPRTPHISPKSFGNAWPKELVALAPWPKYDPGLVPGRHGNDRGSSEWKLREKLDVARGLDRAALEELARQTPKLQKALEGITPKKVIVVPDRLVNFVI